MATAAQGGRVFSRSVRAASRVRGVRPWVTGALAALTLLLSTTLARADDGAPAPTCTSHGPDCIGHWAPMVIRLHGGLGAFLNGGAVSTAVVPNLFEHARVSAELGGEVGARPFGGGTLISLIVQGQAADGAVIGTFGLSLEYDLLYLFGMHDPDQDFALALGGALAMDYAHTFTTSAAGVVWMYDLMRPDWRLYLELRIRNSARERWLIRAQFVTGFDDLLDVASATLCAGYVFEAF